MNWDDLKIFLTIARRKTLSTAAADLKLDETTVSRRLKRLEQQIGQTLFERLRSGHHLTAHGERLLIEAEEIERRTDRIQIVKGRPAQKPSGVLRISVAEGFGARLLAPVLGEFVSRYPDIEIDLVSGSGILSLSKREADVAIGLSRPKSKHIFSKLLSPYTLHLYGSKDYLANHPKIRQAQDLNAHILIDYVDDLIYAEELRYFHVALPQLQAKIRSTSILAQKIMVEQGIGLAILPDFVVSDHFTKVLAQEIQLSRNFWFSTHQSVASLGRVQAFERFAMSTLKANFNTR